MALSTPDVLRTVEEIESFKPKLQLRVFFDIEILHQAEIDRRASRHGECVTPEVAQGIGRRQNESAGVEIQIWSPYRSPYRNSRTTNGNSFHGIVAGSCGEIGRISVVKIENKGRQNRRIIIAPVS